MSVLDAIKSEVFWLDVYRVLDDFPWKSCIGPETKLVHKDDLSKASQVLVNTTLRQNLSEKVNATLIELN